VVDKIKILKRSTLFWKRLAAVFRVFINWRSSYLKRVPWANMVVRKWHERKGWITIEWKLKKKQYGKSLFVNRVAELDELPVKPKVFWYVSAGDFRGPVFDTISYRSWSKASWKRFGKPDLFVYNCLGPEVQDLRIKLSSGRRGNCLMMEEQVL
jgi:hypothetical protein